MLRSDLMRTRLGPRSVAMRLAALRGSNLRRVVITLAGIFVCSGALAVLSTHSTEYALIAALGILGIGVFAAAPLVVVAAAIPATLLVFRVFGGTYGSSLSASDFVLLLSTLAALPMLELREAPVLRRLLGFVLVYEAALIPTIVYNPYRADTLEWFHEALLAGGSLIVGWVVARNGQARRVLGVLLFFAGLLAFAACVAAVRTHFQTVAFNQYSLDKNFIGTMLMFSTLVTFANPTWVGFSGRWRVPAQALFILGIFASHSRQAMVGTVVGVLMLSLRGRRLTRRSKLIFASVIPLAAIAYATIASELASSNQFNSVHQRITWFSQSLQVWRTSPWLGVGLRWWYTARFGVSFQPPNAELEMLTSAGVIGLAAFFYLFGRTLVTLWRLPPAFGTFAFTMILVHFVQGQLDIFWVTATASIPFMLAGLALGAFDRSRLTDEQQTRATALAEPREPEWSGTRA